MALRVDPVYSNWEKLIDNRVVAARYCLESNDFGVNDALIAAELNEDVDHVATFTRFIGNDNPQEIRNVPNELKDINLRAVNEGRNVYEDFRAQVATLRNHGPDPQAWETTIDEAARDARQAADALISRAAAAAKAVIERVPERAREPAAKAFRSGMSFFIGFLESLLENIATVVAAVADFLRGVWAKLESSWLAVIHAAEAAIAFINTAFRAANGEAV